MYRFHVDGELVGTFTVVYVNEALAELVDVPSVDVDGSSYFDPVSLGAAAGLDYEIVSRPDTIGGRAPRIDAEGRFVFNYQLLPVNISRAGEYVVRTTDAAGNIVDVYIITVY